MSKITENDLLIILRVLDGVEETFKGNTHQSIGSVAIEHFLDKTRLLVSEYEKLTKPTLH